MKRILLHILLLIILFISCDSNLDDSYNSIANLYEFFDIPDPENGFAGNIYYVAADGDDLNPGTEALPWRTIQKAADTLVKGEKVYVKEGTYYEKVEVKNSGDKNNPIIFSAYPGDTVTIDGYGINILYWNGIFTIYRKQNIVINGFRVVNSNQSGIFVYQSSNIFIKNNFTYDTYSSGIGVWNSNNIVVDNNEVVLACNDGDQECISVAGCNKFIIRNNQVHDSGPGTNGGEGIDAKHGQNGLVHSNEVYNINRGGIYIDAWDTHTYNIMVYNNITYNCDSIGISVASEAGGLLEYVKIFNNIVYDNLWTGIVVAKWGENVPSHPIQNIQIINNTIYDNGQTTGGGILIQENYHVTNITIKNNIVSQNHSFQIVSNIPLYNLDVTHNLIDGYGGTENEIRGSNHVNGNPNFVNPSIYDFKLSVDSPAIDRGTSRYAPDFDFENKTRPINDLYDLGAYEY